LYQQHNFILVKNSEREGLVDPVTLEMLLGETKMKIVNILKRSPASAQSLARELSIQVTAVRKHLDTLSAMGLVEAFFKREGVGRPKKLYRLTESGMRLVSKTAYDLVLEKTVELLIKELGEESVARLFSSVANELAALPRGTHTMDLADAKLVLDSFGFETVIIKAGKHVDVLSYNCPLKAVALRHQKLVCNHIHT